MTENYHNLSLEDQAAAAMTLNEQGLTCMSNGDFYGAISYHEQALQLMTAICGEESLDVVWVMKHIALMYENMGEYSEALALYEKVLFLRKHILGENHEYVATSLTDLALLLAKMKNYDVAFQLHTDAFQIRQCLLDQHPATAISLNNLGTVCYQMKHHDAALDYYSRAYDMKRACGVTGHTIATTLLNMSVVLNEKGVYNDAVPCLIEAQRVCDNILMAEDAPVYMMIKNLQSKIDYKRSLIMQSMETSEMQIEPTQDVERVEQNIFGLVERSGSNTSNESNDSDNTHQEIPLLSRGSTGMYDDDDESLSYRTSDGAITSRESSSTEFDSSPRLLQDDFDRCI